MPKRFWYVILTYVLMHVSTIVVTLVASIFILNESTLYMVGVTWNILSFIIALVIILYLLRDDMKQKVSRGAAGIGMVVLWSFAGVFMAFAGQMISSLIETFILGIEPGSENTQQIMEITRSFPLFILVVTIIAPILEEIIFRKIIFGSIYKRTNFIIAALASAFVFAVVHTDFTHLLTYTVMGLVFAFLYVQTKRIIVPIIAHMAMNTVVVLAQLSIDPEEVDKMLTDLEKLQFIIGG
ncbi:CPBP family intramembrane metalloprotease [Aquibacillus koreensis]|uniref:CPBP family intramembrane metalloprotease n=1 Tax=Aquibacillus koreensis TaxID=279446 RepID=A0A9X3WML2_9BACI|nr:type II CAAX endopeptidase family protein [Aquibacillus koreensis]MCT2536701.1 CPBP family intramembrane metalloprotease [Aquibacillus koreensis]MDC3421543.1 CPBP family intramembrane metalloprotease [Aquibacillus koreensis]